MTDEQLRKLERAVNEGDLSAEEALIAARIRAGRDTNATIEALVERTRAELLLDPNDTSARERIARVNPYAWTAFIDVARYADRVELRAHERTPEPTVVRSIATKGQAHVLSCGENLYIIDAEKKICIGRDQGVQEPLYGIPCTSIDTYAWADAQISCGTRTVHAGLHGSWVGGDAPIRILGPWRYVSAFHLEGQTTLNITGHSDGRGSAPLNGNVIISDQQIWHQTQGRWNELESAETRANALYSHAREPLSVPSWTRLALDENRCASAVDLVGVHDHTGQTLLIEAPITIIEKLRALPPHFQAKRKGHWSWEQI